MITIKHSFNRNIKQAQSMSFLNLRRLGNLHIDFMEQRDPLPNKANSLVLWYGELQKGIQLLLGLHSPDSS